jgi:hypothetical protein
MRARGTGTLVGVRPLSTGTDPMPGTGTLRRGQAPAHWGQAPLVRDRPPGGDRPLSLGSAPYPLGTDPLPAGTGTRYCEAHIGMIAFSLMTPVFRF